MLENGELLYEQARLVDTPHGLVTFRRLHHRWVLGCLPILAGGFEPESVSEFVHANARIPADGELRSAARAAVCVMRDALELLRGLRATLDYESTA